jgi:uncharacterized Zn-binding protein involved in type VI secretion
MPNVIRNGDINTCLGIALLGAKTVFVNNLNVMLPGMPVTPHKTCNKPGKKKHLIALTKGGSSTVFAEGLPIIHVNDEDTCGHKRLTMSPDVFVGL